VGRLLAREVEIPHPPHTMETTVIDEITQVRVALSSSSRAIHRVSGDFGSRPDRHAELRGVTSRIPWAVCGFLLRSQTGPCLSII